MHALLQTQFRRNTYTFLRGCNQSKYKAQCVCGIKIDSRQHGIKSHDHTGFTTISKSLLINNSSTNFYLFHNLRTFSTSSIQYEKEPLKPSSKVEVTVQELKKKKSEEETKQTAPTDVVPKPPVKKSIKQKIIDELVHYYHGFRLLFIDMKISAVLIWRVLNGKSLTRREYRLLTRTVGDMFRLVPFSVFIIVPFMEFLLPIFIKFFPGMLPSTFQTAKEKEDKIKQSLKIKLEMAKFLQETLDDMAVQHKDHSSDRAKEFAEWFHKIRTSGEQVSNEDIMKFVKLFEDELTLDALSRNQLIALCRVLEVQTLGTNNFLRFQLRMKLRSLAADDKMIQREGVDSLTLPELQQACRARGMRAYGVPEERLRQQLRQWLDLSLNEKVPPSLLLLSRALMLPETIPTSDKLKATISALPETIVTQTTAAIGEKEGKIDNKVKIQVLKEEERKIKEERKERMEEKKKMEMEQIKEKEEELVDKAPIISATTTPILEDTATKISVEKLEKVEKEKPLQAKDFEIIESAIDQISKEKQYIVEKGEIEELKAEMADYKEDVEELSKAVAEQPKPEIRESKAAQRLFNSVNKMINKLDTVLADLEKKEKQLKQHLQAEDTEKVDKTKKELLKIDDIIAAIRQIKDVPDDSRLDQITRVLKKMDVDSDGAIQIEHALKVIEIIGKENVHLSDKQVDELVDLMGKEEILEVEDKIEKALQKDKDKKDSSTAPSTTPPQSPPPPSPPKQGGKKDTKETSKSDEGPKIATPPVIPPPPVNNADKSKPEGTSKTL